MKVFVTGGTGDLGRPVVRLLVERGHEVRGLIHSNLSRETLRSMGAEPIGGDLFDAASLRSSMKGVNAVLHLATHIPPAIRMRSRKAWNENDRIMREGTRNLITAANEREVSVFVYPGVTLVYPDGAAEWIDAASVQPAVAGVLMSTLDAEAEVARFGRDGRGVTLRMGTLYGPTSSRSHEILTLARLGFAAFPGARGAYQPSIWIDDAARAVVMAMEGAPSGVYDVVDDEPLTRRELSCAVIQATARTRLMRLPGFVMRLALGSQLTAILSRSQRVSNQRFREATGWTPDVASAWDGWPRLGAAMLATGEPLAQTAGI